MPHETPIACTLSADDRSARLAAAHELGERALVGLDVHDRRAVLRFHGECGRVDDLVAAERECCPFFEFATARDGDETELEIRTPAGGEPLLRALVAGIVGGWGTGSG
jgi:MerR family transcriptional regulator, copper efflux regulator